MVADRRPCSSIKLKCNALCSNSVFQNVLRNPRSKVMNEQSRALRDTVNKSDLWGSEIHLDESNVFVEAFFTNSALVSKGLDVTFVFVDDTSCTNSFMFPVIAVLCQDASKTTHAVGWGIVRNRTTETFIRFFTFISRSFPRINAFMCDRHFAQSKAIRAVFGDGVHIFHCCIHIARNIKSNTGCDGGLVSEFWAMRFKRTEEAEEQFISSLRKMHSAKKSVFTSQLLESVDTYLPSKVDPVLSQYVSPMFTFPECCVDGLHPPTTELETRAMWVINVLKKVDSKPASILSIDNTNTVESYFNVIKGRLERTCPTLVDLYTAINFTEMSILASRNPCSPELPQCVVSLLLTVVTNDVVNMLTLEGVQCLLDLLCLVALDIILDKNDGASKSSYGLVRNAFETNTPIDTFLWMSNGWVFSTEHHPPRHDVVAISVSGNTTPAELAMRLEPFLSVSNRSVEEFQLLSEALLTLNSMVVGLPRTNTLPANYTFFKKEFDMFISVSSERAEVQAVLSELCVCPLSSFGNDPKTTQQQKLHGNQLLTPVQLK